MNDVTMADCSVNDARVGSTLVFVFALLDVSVCCLWIRHEDVSRKLRGRHVTVCHSVRCIGM